jgi:hypothetical protein
MVSQWRIPRPCLWLTGLCYINTHVLVAGIELDIGSDGAYIVFPSTSHLLHLLKFYHRVDQISR